MSTETKTSEEIKSDLSAFLKSEGIEVSTTKNGYSNRLKIESKNLPNETMEYRVTVSKGSKSFSYLFNTSIVDSYFRAYFGRMEAKYFRTREERDAFAMKNGIQMKHCTNPKDPEVVEVLYRAYENSCEYFEDFCSEFDYSPDSIKAKEIFDSIRKINHDFERTIGKKAAERINEILQDY